MARPPVKIIPVEAYGVARGRWVCEQAVAGKLDLIDVEDIYQDTGGRAPRSLPQQTNKLEVFWHFGKLHGPAALAFLAAWEPPPHGSSYEALLKELRKLNRIERRRLARARRQARLARLVHFMHSPSP